MSTAFASAGTSFLLISVAAVAACAAAPTPAPGQSPLPAPKPSPTATPSPTSGPSPSPAPDLPAGYIDPAAVNSAEVTFPGEGFTIKAYRSKPRGGGTFPGLIIIHENRGLTDHIRDVARRYANQGYLAVAPDLLSRVGGTGQFATTDDAIAAVARLSIEGVLQDLDATFNYLKSLPEVRKDRIGVLGYCWGGGNSLLFATRNSQLSAAVVYYGPNPANINDVANITAPVLGLYGAEDTRITMNVHALEAAMRKYNKSFEQKTYPDAAHAFFNDTGTRYNKEASFDAWQVTNAFLRKYLKA